MDRVQKRRALGILAACCRILVLAGGMLALGVFAWLAIAGGFVWLHALLAVLALLVIRLVEVCCRTMLHGGGDE